MLARVPTVGEVAATGGLPVKQAILLFDRLIPQLLFTLDARVVDRAHPLFFAGGCST